MTDIIPELLVFMSVSITLMLSLPTLRYHVRRLFDEALAGRDLSVGDYAGFYFYTTATRTFPFLGLSYLFVICLTVLTACPEYDFSFLMSYDYYGALGLTVILLVSLLVVAVVGVQRGIRYARIRPNDAYILLGE